MHYKIIAVHVIMNENGKNEVKVAIDDGFPLWKAYESNHINIVGYPLHNTEQINDALFQKVAATGRRMEASKATKVFPHLSKKFLID